MEEAVRSAQLVRFGPFEVDLAAGELRKGGVKLKLAGQPFQVLAILLEHPGGRNCRSGSGPTPSSTPITTSIQPLTRFARCWATRRRARALSRLCLGEATGSLRR